MAGDTKAFNEKCLSLGPDELVKTGELSIKDYEKVLRATQLYKLRQSEVVDLPKLDNVWLYGPPGVGKSRSIRQEHPTIYNKGFNKWWDGYK